MINSLPATHIVRRSRRAALGLLTCLALALSACGSNENPSEVADPGGEGGADCSERSALQVAVVRNYYDALTIVAEDAGIFDKNCLDVELLETDSGPAMTALVVGGQSEIGDTIASALFPLIASGDDTDFLWLTRGLGPTFNLIAGKGVPVPNKDEPWPAPMQDVVGKVIGVTAPGAVVDYVVRAWLDQAGINADQVTIVGVGTAATATAALENGKVDFLVSYPPVQQLLGEENFEMVVNAAQYTENAEGQPAVFNSTAYVTRKSFAEENPTVVQHFCDAIWDSYRFQNDDSNEQEILEIYQERFNLDRAQAESLWKDYRENLNPALPQEVFEDFAKTTPPKQQSFVPDYTEYVHQDCAMG